MTELDEREAFLRAIADAPEDDAPRLVFADWLEERGDSERAEFIRLQCAVARDGDRPEWLARADELLARNRKDWIVPGIPGRQLFGRGFVEYLHVSADEFLAHADRLAGAAPILGLRLSVAADRTSNLVRVG